jgi:hypothetical protein
MIAQHTEEWRRKEKEPKTNKMKGYRKASQEAKSTVISEILTVA